MRSVPLGSFFLACAAVALSGACGSSGSEHANPPGDAGGDGAAVVAAPTDGASEAGLGGDTGPTAMTSPDGGLAAGPGQCDPSKWMIASLPAVGTAGVDYLSDLQEESGAINGLDAPGAGNALVPFGKDVGSGGAGGGGPLVIDGVCYPKGLGVRAWSIIQYKLAGAYKQFVSDTGWDYLRGSQLVIFEVSLDGKLIYDGSPQGLPTKNDKKTLTIDVTGVNELKVTVRDWNDVTANCFAVWGGARLVK